MGVCKKLEERHLTVMTPAAFKTALDAKDAELAEAKRRIAQLKSQSKTTNITVNNHTTAAPARFASRPGRWLTRPRRSSRSSGTSR